MVHVFVGFSQAGVLTFGNVVYRWVELNWFIQKADLVTSVSSLPFVGERRNTSGALWYARYMMFQPDQGDRPDARNICKYVVAGPRGDPDSLFRQLKRDRDP